MVKIFEYPTKGTDQSNSIKVPKDVKPMNKKTLSKNCRD